MRNILNSIDIKEDSILRKYPIILSTLLLDRTTNKNIIWATDNYKLNGKEYGHKCQIKQELITGKKGKTIKPRSKKSKKEQYLRSREDAEVFTPSWMCNIQNNLIDERWFGYKNVFNESHNSHWDTNENKIRFPKNKTWKKYVKDTRLEISCGEAPYIVSRYDTVTGKKIPIKNRIGLLDRKLRVISENVTEKDEWLKWAELAYKSIYGYDLQGDNVLIARENLLFTLRDYYKYIFHKNLDENTMLKFAEIISWNIWQMDGIKGVVPNSCHSIKSKNKGEKPKKCTGCEKNDILKHNGKYCQIMDWQKNEKVKFISLISKEK